MLAEWFTYLTTPSPRHLRRQGYLREIVGTRSRFARCRDAWEPHLQNTRETILDAARQAPSRRKALILGSGWLYDIPLAELAARFDEVVLADILHMPVPRRAGAQYPNVRLLQTDLTGLAEPLGRLTAPSPLPLSSGALPEVDADLIVSANLLSQLPYLPVRYLRKKRPDASEAEIEQFARSLIRHHLAQLAQAQGTVCLITEVEHLTCDGDAVIERSDPLYGIDPGPPDRDWTWEIAPRPEIDRHCDVKYRVIGRTAPPKP